MSSLLTGYVHLTATRYMQVIGITIACWDYCATFDSEVNYFWKSQYWTWARFLFFSNRYFAIFALAINTYALTNSSVTDAFCTNWVRYYVTYFGAMEIFILQALLLVRIHAMYGRKKSLLYSLLALYTSSNVTALVLVSISVHRNPVTAHPAPGLVVCTSLSPPKNIWAFWIPILVFETTMFSFAVKRTVTHLYFNHQHIGRTRTSEILQIVLRDSVIYFMFILASYATNALIWRFSAPDLLDIVHGPTLGISSTIGSRMMINMRVDKKRAEDTTAVVLQVYAPNNGNGSSTLALRLGGSA